MTSLALTLLTHNITNTLLLTSLQAVLASLKESALARDPVAAPLFASTDDFLSAKIWRALCKARIAQLGIPKDSNLETTMARACNFRGRTEPKLGESYFANGVSQVWTTTTVKDLLSSSLTSVALKLRASLSEHQAETVVARAKWLLQEQGNGHRTRLEVRVKDEGWREERSDEVLRLLYHLSSSFRSSLTPPPS